MVIPVIYSVLVELRRGDVGSAGLLTPPRRPASAAATTTTHWAATTALESLGATYQRKRWVEDGKFIMSAGVSAGIDMGLYLAARLTDEASARQVQLWLDYDPQPPFGRLNYDDMGFRFRLARLAGPLTAPLLTARPKRLTRQERAAGATAS
jgi:hypothetical protein